MFAVFLPRALVDQRIEQKASNLLVASSIPAEGAFGKSRLHHRSEIVVQLNLHMESREAWSALLGSSIVNFNYFSYLNDRDWAETEEIMTLWLMLPISHAEQVMD